MNAIVSKANYKGNYLLEIEFQDKKKSIVDFEPFLRSEIPQYLKKYLEIENFQKFYIANGNVIWGEDWDLVFPREQLYDGKIHVKTNSTAHYS